MAPTDRQLFDLTIATDCYKELDAAEHNKVNLAVQGKPASTPRSNIGKVAFYLARRVWPVQPPPPPPPTYKKVAPRVAYADGGSDARYCLKDFPSLRDDVAQYSPDGLCLGAERSGGSKADCPTSAKEIDGREYCSLPTMGDPLQNTGSWTI